MKTRSPPKTPQARLRQLVPYYAGCLRMEANRGATALSGEVAPRWFEPPGVPWHRRGLKPVRWPADALPPGLLDRACTAGAAASRPVFYGYPLLALEGNTGAGGAPAWIPALLCPIELRRDGNEVHAARTDDPPMINADFLGAIARTPEERQQASKALREALADDPALVRLAAHLNDRAGVQCELQARGLVLAGTASAFTSGLEAELQRLRACAGQVDRTALGVLLGGPGTLAEPVPVVEALALDDTQRTVVEDAAEYPLTVATGPAGTGKTQVVVAALTSVLCAGGTALFASRNHQAVNLVEARMAELVGRPVLMRAGLRAGRRDLRHAMIEALKALLSGTTPGAAAELQVARKTYRWAVRRRTALWEKIDRLAERFAAGHREDTAPPLNRERIEDLMFDAAQLDGSHWIVRRVRGWLDRALRDRWRALRESIDTTPSLSVVPPAATPIEEPEAWYQFLRDLRCQPLPRQERHRPGDLAEAFADSLSGADADVRTAGRDWVDAHLRERAGALSGALRADLGAYRAALEQSMDSGDGPVKTAMAEQFSRLLAALPLWSVTHLSVHNTVPLQDSLFDLVILDEASQSDIASALPLLYRARRALIIGDANQLRHVATLTESADRHLRDTHGLTQLEDQPFGFARNSLFDLALTSPAARVHFLDGHYRAHRDLIEFSNRQWYGGRLRVRTDYGRLRPGPGDAPLRWIPVSSRAVPARGGGVVVAREADAVIEQIRALYRSGYDGTIGVVAPFRAQVSRMRRAIGRLDPRWVAERRLLVSTAHGFQGDERDLIIISLCVAGVLPTGARRFLAHGSHLLNVALTRARSTCILVGDLDACADSGMPPYEALAAYALRGGHFGEDREGAAVLEAFGASEREGTAVGPDEQALIEALRAAGLHVTGQYPVDQYVVDLLVSDGQTELLVEVDGMTVHTQRSGHRLREDLVRDARLRARGWVLVRLWAHQVREDPDGCVERVLSALAGGAPLNGCLPPDAAPAPGTEAAAGEERVPDEGWAPGGGEPLETLSPAAGARSAACRR